MNQAEAENRHGQNSPRTMPDDGTETIAVFTFRLAVYPAIFIRQFQAKDMARMNGNIKTGTRLFLLVGFTL